MSRLVVITGASGGIGRATAREFARRGDRLALLARGEVGLAAAQDEVRELGAEALTVSVDMADADAVEAAVEQIETELGPIDVWVNVAFTSVFARFTDITPAEFRRATEVSYLGYVYATMAVLKRMRIRNAGTIVHVGSALAYRGIPLQTAYCGAKHGIQGFHESLRCELLHEKSNVKVTMVQMPALNTPQFSWVLSRLPEHPQPVPPIYQPEVAARAVAYAADHPQRREYWVGASTVVTLMANAVVPGLLDRYLGRTGFASQQTGELKTEGQPENLWEPADG
ncbi:MAG: SDR family oxidoreductase, partial [Microlunatus sp.]|nr:SDR family oxidoreductase [Microlunatus sp.]